MKKKRPTKKPFRPQIQEEVFRVKLPGGREVMGILEERVGGSRARVRCLDGKTRICRIPGRLKRRLWIRAGDILIIEPWESGGDEKGDIIYKYRPNQVTYLKKQKYLDKLQDFQEF